MRYRSAYFDCRWLHRLSLALILFPALSVTGCKKAGADSDHSQAGGSPVTDIAIGTTVKQSKVKRLGINLSGQNYYDSGQIMRNLLFRNPGFEAETWQSIIRCKTVTANSCTDGNKWDQWPADFLKGADVEFITGQSKGIRGTVTTSTKAGVPAPDLGVTFSFTNTGNAPTAGDFVIVRMDIPGNPTAGWWPNTKNSGSSFSTETSDLAPNSSGKQALRISASGPGQRAVLDSYFDSYNHGRSFVQIRGPHRLAFRAKSLGGKGAMNISITRLIVASGNEVLLGRTVVPLTSKWTDYSFPFVGKETGQMIGTLDVSFDVEGADVLLDDVSLAETAAKDNPTAFRNSVVDTLRSLRPGVLRYMDNGTDFGSSFDNMIAPVFARKRAGSSLLSVSQEDIPIGLNEFLLLCQTVGAEPWYVMPAGTSPDEARNLIDYLSAPPTNPYGAKRLANGQASPWTSVFPNIHLELGNEQWNSASFYGSSIYDPVAFGQRAAEVFSAARSSTSYSHEKVDLILGSFAVVPWWTQQELTNGGMYDSTAIAPYLFNEFKDSSSTEAIFGSMFAQPEMIDSQPSGYVAQQAKAAREASRPAQLSVYEVNLSSTSGTASQSTLDAVIPSVGAGIAVADHMLLMLRDLGVTNQALFALTEYVNGFHNTTPGAAAETMPLWGAVVDMDGSTNLRRPQFLAEALVNTAVLDTLLDTKLTGADPTWQQKLSENDKIKLDHAHLLQTFAFSEGRHRSVIVFNLSRDQSLPVTFSGRSAPTGSVAFSQLTSKNITDTNEVKEIVVVKHTALTGFNPKSQFLLPPFSINVLQWDTTP